MNFKEYQRQTGETAIYPGHNHSFPTTVGLSYLTLKLNGESGEVAELIGKMIRDDDGMLSPERTRKLSKELGDVLWYVAQLAKQAHLSMDMIAEENLAKLADRKKRGVIRGSGSDR